MADLSDVEVALVNVCRLAVPDLTIVIGRGWPTPSQLADALKISKSIISIFSLPGFTRNTSRYSQEWRTLCTPIPSMSVAYVNGVAVFTGTGVSTGLQVSVVIGSQSWAYPIGVLDTGSTVAAALAALVPGSSAQGNAFTIPTGVTALVGLAVASTVFRELERQWQAFRVTVWSPTPSARDALCSAIGAELAAVDFLPLADGTTGWKQYEGTFLDDKASAEGLWKRDLRYRVEYATVQTMQAQEVLFALQSITLM